MGQESWYTVTNQGNVEDVLPILHGHDLEYGQKRLREVVVVVPDGIVHVFLDMELVHVHLFTQEGIDQDEQHQEQDDIQELLVGPLHNIDDDLQVIQRPQ